MSGFVDRRVAGLVLPDIDKPGQHPKERKTMHQVKCDGMKPAEKRVAILEAAKAAGPRYVRLRGVDLVEAIEAKGSASKAKKPAKKGGDPK